MRLLGVEVQQMLDGNQSAADAVANAQAKWEAEF